MPPGDSEALATKIREVATDPRRLTRMSRKNLETARHYRAEILREKRIGFYQYVREQTGARLAGQKKHSGVASVQHG